MNKFSKIINPIHFSKLTSAKEKLEYLIQRQVYIFSRHDFESRPERFFIGQNSDSRRLEKNFRASNSEALKGCIYLLNPKISEYLTEYFSAYVENTSAEDKFLNKEKLFSLLEYVPDQNEKKDLIKNLLNESLKKLTESERFMEGEIYFHYRNDMGYKELLSLFIRENTKSASVVLDYLKFGDPLITNARPHYLEIWTEFEIEIDFLNYLSSLLKENNNNFNLANVKNGINRFPNIFNSAEDCELFHYCIDNYQDMKKRTYSIFFQWFQAQEKIKTHRGIIKIFQKFVCDHFENVTKIESEIDRDLSLEFEYLKNTEVEFQTKL